MKLVDLLMVIANPEQKVVVKDAKSRRIQFEGCADGLFDYSALDEKRVRGITIKGDVLEITTKNKIGF